MSESEVCFGVVVFRAVTECHTLSEYILYYCQNPTYKSNQCSKRNPFVADQWMPSSGYSGIYGVECIMLYPRKLF